MRAELNSYVRVVPRAEGRFELLDSRTGFHVNIETDPNLGIDVERLTREASAFLVSIGAFGDRSYRDLRALQRSVRDELQEESRMDSIKTLLKLIESHVPYYRQRAHIYSSVSPTDFSSLPTLDRNDLRRGYSSFLVDDRDFAGLVERGELSLTRTSGTSGERMRVYSDMTLARVPPDFESVWGVRFGSDTPRTAVITSQNCSSHHCSRLTVPMAERVRFGSVLYLDVPQDIFSIDDRQVRRMLDEIEAFQPEILLVNPIYLHWVVRRALSLGLEPPRTRMVLSSYQHLSRVQREAMEDLLGAPVFNTYTATELGGCGIAVECKFGHWHVREDQVYVEIESGERRHPPGVGDIVVTTTANRIAPLVRYMTGDVAKWCQADCECPLSDWRCLEFHGRGSECLSNGAMIITTRQFDEVISHHRWIDFYQVTQRKNDEIVISVVPSERESTAEEHLRESLSEAFGFRSIRVDTVSRLRPAASQKYPMIVSGAV